MVKIKLGWVYILLVIVLQIYIIYNNIIKINIIINYTKGRHI